MKLKEALGFVRSEKGKKKTDCLDMKLASLRKNQKQWTKKSFSRSGKQAYDTKLQHLKRQCVLRIQKR
jgi:hypothetical protein